MSSAIKRMLIANRGEIACRIMHSARRRGIATVAVYSDADRKALHVQQADEAVHIGNSPSTESYLVIERIVEAARTVAADAVHPGYGFLSENARFAVALEEAGIRFIGPGVRAIEAMGDKITSKRLAEEAGVNTIPGHPEALSGADEAERVAREIGCPVMLKASAGGGGKGMRIARHLQDVRDGFNSARSEAQSSFGDDRVFIEKYIEQPRHIEIQVIADTHGTVLYLGERECSIQRRHQKVIEEAPSAFISEATRQAMGEQAVALARAVDYRSAGTVEFIVDAEQNFYFLEMNTRLQVEHPVTELVTGLDLVDLMIDVAEGKRLPLAQDAVKLDGWAFEARVYAEDVDRGFLPSTGRLLHYDPPDDLDGIRVDSGVTAGGEISMFYDPMIAKLISWGPDRESARARMRRALDAYRIEGLRHNLPFLAALFAHPAFEAGELSTAFIDTHFADGFNSRAYTSEALPHFPLLAAWLEHQLQTRDSKGSLETPAYVVLDGEQRHTIEHELLNAVSGDWSPGEAVFEGLIDGHALTIGIRRHPGHWELSSRGSVRDYRVILPHVADLLQWMPASGGDELANSLLSPMPGLLVKLHVGEGDEVSPGQELATIEAMKMENILRADSVSKVSAIVVEEGDNLAVDQVIMEFEA